MKGPLNLASRPFRNENLAVLAGGILGALLVVATVGHGWLLYSLVRGGRSRREGELRALAAEEQRLRAEAASIRVVRATPATVVEWRTLKELVDRRTFSWTGLFSRFEEILPPGVRISSIAPSVERGVTSLEVIAYVETPEAGLEFLKRLGEAGDFPDATPTLEGDETPEGRPFHYKMHYVPRTVVEKGGT
jgi:hypothetical protein